PRVLRRDDRGRVDSRHALFLGDLRSDVLEHLPFAGRQQRAVADGLQGPESLVQPPIGGKSLGEVQLQYAALVRALDIVADRRGERLLQGTDSLSVISQTHLEAADRAEHERRLRVLLERDLEVSEGIVVALLVAAAADECQEQAPIRAEI